QDEISTLSRRLYPAILRRGLTPALRSLADQFDSVLPVELKVDDLAAAERTGGMTVPEGVRLAAYRIVEEALSNTAKHARATGACVEVRLEPTALRVLVRDDGRGFSQASSGEGLGLTAMQDYAAAVGGDCELSTGPGQTLVEASFPLPTAAPVATDQSSTTLAPARKP